MSLIHVQFSMAQVVIIAMKITRKKINVPWILVMVITVTSRERQSISNQQQLE